ncbi:MAG: anthranilate synthase component I family protein, partial [bacterium]|nr:anthranilate synthase component I family protein [bacterium]
MIIEPSESKIKNMLNKGYSVVVKATVLSDDITPTLALRRIYKNSKYAFLFESAERLKGRYSFLFSGSDVDCIYSDGKNIFYSNNKEKDIGINALRRILKKRIYAEKDLPACIGGAVGCVSYDYVRKLEKIGDRVCDFSVFPEFFFIVLDRFIFFDHFHNTISAIKIVEDEKDLKNTIDELRSTIAQIFRPLPYMEPVTGTVEFEQKNDKKKFIKNVKKAKEYIYNGDAIQIVLSRRIDFISNISPLEIYRHLRFLNPSPYMYFYKFDEKFIIGSSPEALVTLKDGIITIRPIAGTRPRGKDEDEDLKLEQELKKNEKEISEHTMLVDLARNDIGRVSNRVDVKEFMIIEKYSHVMHIVSDVKGVLKNDCDAFDVFNAVFPAGTVTGAPKIRAMQI